MKPYSKSPFHSKLAFLLMALLCPAGVRHLLADSFLIPSSPDIEPSQFTLQIPAGVRPFTIVPVPGPKRLTVLLHLDGLSPEQWPLLKTRLEGLLQATREWGGFSLIVISQGETETWSAIKRVNQLQAVLFKQSPAPLPEGSREWKIYAEISNNFPNPSSSWDALLIVSISAKLSSEEFRFYTEAYLSHLARRKKLRLYCWPIQPWVPANVSGQSSSTPGQNENQLEDINWKRLTASTGGSVFSKEEEPVSMISEMKEESSLEVAFSTPALSQGVFPCLARLTENPRHMLISEIPILMLSPEGEPLSLDQYAELQYALSSAQRALAENKAEQVRLFLARALSIDPIHAASLHFGVGLYKQQHDWTTALKLLTPLSGIIHDDASLYEELGELNFQLRQWEESEKALIRSLSLAPQQPQVLELLSRVREARGDYRGALEPLIGLLQVEPSQAHYWVRKGALLEKLGQAAEAAAAYEKGLMLEPANESVRTHLIEQYFAGQAREKGLSAMRGAAETAQRDAALAVRYALLAEKVKQAYEALNFYQLALKTEPANESALFGQARLLSEIGRAVDARKALADGLQKVPTSVRLHLLNIDLLEREGLPYEKRAAIEAASGKVPDNLEILKRAAESRDEYGNRSGEAYEKLAEAMEKTGSSKDLLSNVLERGAVSALRDGDRSSAIRLASRLRLLGKDPFPALRPLISVPPETAGLWVPGGIKALAFAAHMQGDVSASVFAAEYASTLVRSNQGGDNKEGEALLDELRNYFRTVAALKRLADLDGQKSHIQMRVSTKKDIEDTERILQWLGWKLKRSQSKIVLEVSAKEKEAQRQSAVSALGIDEIEMKTKLESGQPFAFEIVDERVPAIFEESYWFEHILEQPRPPGGLLEAFIDNLRLARLYAGLASMNSEAQRQVMASNEPRKLLNRYSDLLYFYGPALAVEKDELVLPGGIAAKAVWQKLAGVNSPMPAQFISALLAKDDGKLFAYYHSIVHLPAPQQKFFTKNASRLAAFYKVFPYEAEKDTLSRHAYVRSATYFHDLARELPLDENQDILFPGSPNIWMVAKGGSKHIDSVGRLMRRAAKVTPPEIEDEILLKMLETHYGVGEVRFSQVQNFLSVVRLEEHRTEPMDEQMALLLSQNFAEFKDFYPYFASLPSLTSKEMTQFLLAAQGLERLNNTELNTALGEFDALVHLVVLLRENGAISDDDATNLFGSICEGFARSRTSSDYATCSLEQLKRLVTAVKPVDSKGADARLMHALTGDSRLLEFNNNNSKTISIDRGAWKRRRMEAVLRLQTITPLDVLMTLYENAMAIAKNGPDSSAALRAIERSMPGLLEVPNELQQELNKSVRGTITITRPEDLNGRLHKLKKELLKKKSKNLSRMVAEFVAELNPYVKTALVGWVYAYYFSPKDLAIAEDPFLVRRHDFTGGLGMTSGKKACWAATDDRKYEHGTGRYIEGGLAQIAAVSGRWGLLQREVGDSVSVESSNGMVAAMQLAAARAMPWAQIDPESIHLVGLIMRFGREVLIQAALNPEIAVELKELTMGLVGPVRRLQLIQRLAQFDIQGAVTCLSSSDLFQIATLFWNSHGGDELKSSLVARALEKELRQVPLRQAEYFGGYHAETYGCIHSHLVPLGPYEDFVHRRFVGSMAERLSHLFLNLAETADAAGIPADGLAILGEFAVRQAAMKNKMNDRDDWTAALGAMSNIEIQPLLSELERQEVLKPVSEK